MESKSAVGFNFKRTIATLIDISLLVISTLFIYFMAIEPIFNKITNIENLREEYNLKYEQYNVMIWNEELGTYVENENATDEMIVAFNNDPKVVELYEKISTIEYSQFVVACTTSSIAMYLLIPLISRNGRTIGKKALGLIVISSNNEPLKKSQIAIRGCSFIIIELIGGLLTYGIIPLISFALVNFSSNKKSLHDYLSKTNVETFQIVKEKVVNEDEDTYYDEIKEEEFRDLRIGGRKK